MAAAGSKNQVKQNFLLDKSLEKMYNSVKDLCTFFWANPKVTANFKPSS